MDIWSLMVCGRQRVFLLALCLLSLSFAQAQDGPVIRSEVDTTNIRIGEQIRFTVRVEADTTAQVIFPEGQTFAPLETVEALKTDTTIRDGRMELIKTYALTQFDSGNYLLPTQRIEIDGAGFFTDSLRIAVGDVAVDTTAQKLYDIKASREVEAPPMRLWPWLLGLAIVALIGGGVYYFFFREKPLSEEEQEALLPPYERAMLNLKKLEESPYLIQDAFKPYYTELTGIVRSYLEEEIEVDALESTTDQLITKLEIMRDAGKLNLEPGTLIQFQKILQTADLVKFARSRPEMKQAEADREAIRNIVERTHEAIPEPTEEELLQQEAYREALEAERRKKRLRIAGLSLAGVLVLGFVSAISLYGFQTVKESIFGSPSKSLLEGEWIASSYGYPPILMETPEVLLRQEVPEERLIKAGIQDMDVFMFSDPGAGVSIFARSLAFADREKEPDFAQNVEEVLTQMEAQGAKNLITKQEEYETKSGVKGLKVFGSGRFTLPDSDEQHEGEYTILIFGGKGFMQQIILSWRTDNTYNEATIERILENLDVKLSV